MLLKVRLAWNVILFPESLEAGGLDLQESITICLLDNFAVKKATQHLGHYLGVTTLEWIGEGKVLQQSGHVFFPVVFRAFTFEVCRGEILEGVLWGVTSEGVLLRCGPVETLFLSNVKMPDYRYVAGENPHFWNDEMSKIIGQGVVVRFVVTGTRWLEANSEFQALVSLEGDDLGPVSP